MSEPIAYLNGQFVPYREAKLPVFDVGIVQGATVTERLRTAAQRPIQVREHLDRLEQSMDLVGWSDLPSRSELTSAITRVTELNAALLSADQELAIVLFVTGGPFLLDAFGLAELPAGLTCCVYAVPLPQESWEPLFREGIHLYTSQVRAPGPDCIDSRIKHRSRLFWYMADRQIRARDPLGMALLQDGEGRLTETSSSNLFIVQSGRLYTPSRSRTLPGIMQKTVMDVATGLDLTVHQTDVTIEQLQEADEAFLTSSTFVVMPATQFNGQMIGAGVPGELTTQLLGKTREFLGIPRT